MKAIIFFSLTKKQNSRKIASKIEGDHFEIENLEKSIKFVVFKMLYYGYKAIGKKKVKYKAPEIDFKKYDEIVLVSPVWAGNVCSFMRQYLEHNIFKNKDVTIIASANGMNNKYFLKYDGLLDETNKVKKHIMYVKDKIIYERMV